MYDVSIILVNYKSKFLTENCIKSIYNSQCQLKFEIIVIDNHSEDGSVDYLRGKFPSVKVIDSKKNSGFAFANNMGVRIADGKYVLLLNNDTVILRNMIDALYRALETDSSIGVLGSRAVNGDNIELPITHKYENLKTIKLQTYLKPILEKLNIQRKLVSIFKQNESKNKEIIFTDWIAGSALFLKRNLYYKINGLDENFFMYMEDEDLCHRINDAGYKVGILNKIYYIHYCGGSTIQSYFLTKEYFKSRLLFFKRYFNKDFIFIKKSLYNQIKVINTNLSPQQLEKMKLELDSYVNNYLEYETKNVKGVIR